MQRRGRSSLVLAMVVLALVPLAIASAAWACARLATLKLNRATASAGDEVTAIGRNFNSDRRSSPVAIRFNSRNGEVLWEGRPDSKGRFRGTFEVPAARAGYYVILATQTTAEGRPAAGTPGRASLRMRSARASRRSEALPAAGTGSGPPPAAGVFGGLLIAGLMATGLMAASGVRRKARTT